MKNLINIMEVPTKLVIKFESDKTPGEVYEHSITCIDQAIDFIVALASPDLLQTLERKLLDWTAKVVNAQITLKGKVLARGSFEEIREEERLAEKNSNAWTIEYKKTAVQS